MAKEAISLLANDVLANKAEGYAEELLYWESVISLKKDIVEALQDRKGFEEVKPEQITAVDFFWLDVDDQRQPTERLERVEKLPVLLVSNDGEKIKNRRGKLGAKVATSFISDNSYLAVTGDVYGGYVCGVEMNRDMFGNLRLQDLISKRPLTLTGRQDKEKSLSNCLVIVGRELVGEGGVLAMSVKLSNNILGEIFDKNDQLRDEGGVKELRRLKQKRESELERLEGKMLDLTKIEPRAGVLEMDDEALFNDFSERISSSLEDRVGVLKGGVGVEGLELVVKRSIDSYCRTGKGLKIEAGELEMTLSPVVLPPEGRQVKYCFLLAGTGKEAQRDREGRLKITVRLFKGVGLEIEAWFEDGAKIALNANADFFTQSETVARLMTVLSSKITRESRVVFEAPKKRTPEKLKKQKPPKKNRRKPTNRR